MTATTEFGTAGYLSVLAWPEGAAVSRISMQLAPQLGLEVADLQRWFNRTVPLVCGAMSASRAQAAARAIVRTGGDAFAPTGAELAAAGAPVPVRDLSIEGGWIQIMPWRGTELIRIAPADLRLLVRLDMRGGPEEGGVELGLAIMPEPGRVTQMVGVEPGPRREHHLLDVVLRDGRCFRVDGDRFAFLALGALRGHGDRANMRALSELLQHLAPSAVVDDFFPLWRPPDLASLHWLGRASGDEAPLEFVFYRRWATLMYEYLEA